MFQRLFTGKGVETTPKTSTEAHSDVFDGNHRPPYRDEHEAILKAFIENCANESIVNVFRGNGVVVDTPTPLADLMIPWVDAYTLLRVNMTEDEIVETACVLHTDPVQKWRANWYDHLQAIIKPAIQYAALYKIDAKNMTKQ